MDFQLGVGFGEHSGAQGQFQSDSPVSTTCFVYGGPRVALLAGLIDPDPSWCKRGCGTGSSFLPHYHFSAQKQTASLPASHLRQLLLPEAALADPIPAVQSIISPSSPLSTTQRSQVPGPRLDHPQVVGFGYDVLGHQCMNCYVSFLYYAVNDTSFRSYVCNPSL